MRVLSFAAALATAAATPDLSAPVNDAAFIAALNACVTARRSHTSLNLHH